MPLILKPRTKNVFILIIIFLAGFFLRFRYVNGAEFPLNDGGLFYHMTRELIANNYRLPEFSTYNLSNIPFAYPPLGFYITGLISQVLSIDLLRLFIWFPFITNLLAIPVIFLLAKRLLKKDSTALLATAFWTICLPSYNWLIMGGGVTRSLAFTASYASLYFFISYLGNFKKKHLLFAILFGGITGLSHLEIFWVLSLSVLVLCFYYKKTSLQIAIRDLVIFYTGCILVMSPYLIKVLTYHGISPYLAGFSTGGYDLIKQIFNLVLFNFTEEFTFTVIAALGLFGLFYQVSQRQYGLVSWFFVILFLDPRSVDRSILIVVSILSAIAIEEIIIPALLQNIKSNGLTTGKMNLIINFRKAVYEVSLHVLSIGIFLTLQIFLLAYFQYYAQINSTERISENELAAFQWISVNTQPENTFMLITSAFNWETDQVSEWFPALTDRQNVSTVQGSEWIPNNGHKISGDFYDTVNACLKVDFSCVEEALIEQQIKVDYYFFSINNCVAESAICPKLILASVLSSNNYEVVYKNSEVVILGHSVEN